MDWSVMMLILFFNHLCRLCQFFFSCVLRLVPPLVTPWTAARLLHLWEFLGKEYWNGLPFPSPGDLPNPGM